MTTYPAKYRSSANLDGFNIYSTHLSEKGPAVGGAFFIEPKILDLF
jgi:hypothetical protein